MLILLWKIHFSKYNIRCHNGAVKNIFFLVTRCSHRQKWNSFFTDHRLFPKQERIIFIFLQFLPLVCLLFFPSHPETISSGFWNGQFKNVYRSGCVHSIRTFGTRFIRSRFFYFSKNKKKISFNSDLCVLCVLFSRPFFNQLVDRLGGGREGFGCPVRGSINFLLLFRAESEVRIFPSRDFRTGQWRFF